MSVLSAKQLYDFSLQQIASESFLNIASTNNYAGPDLARALRLGSNNPANTDNLPTNPRLPGKTRMTDQQIADFTANNEIIAHQANTASGFSGTLFQRVTRNASGVVTSRGAFTLSFRSTEFADESQGGDWFRDGVSGADGEMKTYGFALAQLADAEAFFRKLKTDAILPGNASYNVSGYSLGGHLASVFTPCVPI